MAEENTHAQVVTGAGGTAAGDTLIGSITLPAGGPWIIHDLLISLAAATATAGEGVGGFVRVEAAQGDMVPNPSPARFPVFAANAFLGATEGAVVSDTQRIPVLWEAPGKATINFYFNNVVALTVAPQLVIGIIFGKSIPEARRISFMDQVSVGITAATDTAIGTITLSERATRITRVAGMLLGDNVIVAGEELIGFFRLTSDDADIVPAQFPFTSSTSAGLSATVMGDGLGQVQLWEVDFPVTGGARIDCFVDLNTAVTNAARAFVFLGYE